MGRFRQHRMLGGRSARRDGYTKRLMKVSFSTGAPLRFRHATNARFLQEYSLRKPAEAT